MNVVDNAPLTPTEQALVSVLVAAIVAELNESRRLELDDGGDVEGAAGDAGTSACSGV